MPFDPVPEITETDRAQWDEHDYGLVYHFANFARLANSVVTDEGDLQGWFGEALWRHYSYAPFNLRVMENYHSLAFFYGYDRPWNVYHKDERVLERLRLALNYTFARMGENGAIPEYATAELDTPMLAPSSFGMEYMASALEVAGDVLPDDLKGRLAEHAKKAATYVLTSEESWEHARAFTNQFLGSMAGGLQLARLTDDDELRGHVEVAFDALLEEGDFMSPMGFLYENSGPETFAYFFVTLHRLIPLYHESHDDRVLEVLRRHCAWMSRWMLLEPDGETVLLAGAHQTRTGGGYRMTKRGSRGIGALLSTADQAPRVQNGIEALVGDGTDERRYIKLFLSSKEEIDARHASWSEGDDPIAACRARSVREGYTPVSTLHRLPPYAPPATEQAEIRKSLPCVRGEHGGEWQEDDRGNRYAFIRHPEYYTAMSFATRRTTANNGPGFLWRPEAGTLILSENGNRPCWESVVGDRGTGKGVGKASMREGRGGYEILCEYEDMGFSKTYVALPDGIDVQMGTRQTGGMAITERIPLLLRDDDVIHVDYGSCPAVGMGTRVLGLVTRELTIERGGRPVLRFDLGAPVQTSLDPTYDPDGYIRTLMTFSPPSVYFNRTGYRIRVL